MSKTSIHATIKVQALHHWPQAASQLPEVFYLSHPHLHEFRIRLFVEVQHENRDVEFIQLSRLMRDHLDLTYEKAGSLQNSPYDFGAASCETIAAQMLSAFPYAYRAEVDEDDLYGAAVER